jgi:hypothetical protein
MKPLFTDKPPFENPPRLPERIQWVKPELVCELSGSVLKSTSFHIAKIRKP